MSAPKRRGVGNRKRLPADDAADQARKVRQAETWRLRHVEGLSYREIAKRQDISLGSVANDIVAARATPPDVAAYVKIANARLEPVMDVMRDAALDGDTQAANALAKLTAEHAKLNGLHAPTKTELTGTIDVKATQDELLGKLARLAAAGGASTDPQKPDG